MVHAYRGTYFKNFAQNFDGDIIENRTGSQWNELYITHELARALKYALQYQDEEHSYLPLLLLFEIPNEDVYIVQDWDREENKPVIKNNENKLLEKAKNGKQVVIKKDKADKKWRAPFLKTKFLKAIIEVPSHIDSKIDLKKKGNRIEIKGNSKRVKKYIRER